MKYGSLLRSTVSNANFLNLSLLSRLACSLDCNPPPPCFELTRSWSNIVAWLVAGYGVASARGDGDRRLVVSLVRASVRLRAAPGAAMRLAGWPVQQLWGSGALRSRSDLDARRVKRCLEPSDALAVEL